MKYYKLLSLGLVLSVTLLNAQTDFRPGYIIKNSCDTIFGEIDYRDTKKMSILCKFKADDNKNITEYYPDDILGYRFIDSKYFVSRTLGNHKVFLECLISGEIKIYYTEAEYSEGYYIDKDSIGLKELPYEEGIKWVNDKPKYYESDHHIKLLRYYMIDAPKLQAQINTFNKPQHRNLIKLVKAYQNIVCNEEECIVYEKPVPPIKIAIEPVFGLKHYWKSNSYNIEKGGYIYVWLPGNSEKIFLKSGIIHNNMPEGEGAIERNLRLVISSGYMSDLIYSTLRIPFQIQYIYKAHKLQPNLSGGFNVLSFEYANHYATTMSFSLNTGLNYKFTDTYSLSTGIDYEFTPLSLDEMKKTNIKSSTAYIGLRIDF